jgi:hypothetical protein
MIERSSEQEHLHEFSFSANHNMNKIVFVLLLALAAACGSPRQETPPVEDTTEMSQEGNAQTTREENSLTVKEAQNGWRLLFDGKTMQGWRSFKNLENNSWEVMDGTLHCKPFDDDTVNNRSDLITEVQFENFEFAFDWKIAPQTNSGVMFRVTEEMKETYETGPEYQIIDNEGAPGDLEKTQLTGANYHMYYPGADAKVNEIGEWNQSKIVVDKNHVEHWLNGIKVTEYEIGSDDWKKKIAASKWKDFPKYGAASRGHLSLQDHKQEVWFRNLKIRTL